MSTPHNTLEPEAPRPFLTQQEIDLYQRLADLRTAQAAWDGMSQRARAAYGRQQPEAPPLDPQDPALLRLQDVGLLETDPAQPLGYRLVDPAVLEAVWLVEARQRALSRHLEALAELETVRQVPGVLARLKSTYDYGSHEVRGTRHEYVTGLDAINEAVRQLTGQATDEILTAQPGPRPAGAVADGNRLAAEALARGVGMRTIYGRESLTAPEPLSQFAEGATASGAEVRILDEPYLPFLRMICFDRTWLVAEVRDARPVEHSELTRFVQALVTDDPATVGAFVHNFERDWQRARAFQLGPFHDQIIAALIAGADYEAVSRSLKVTTRTINKKVAQHREALGASTPFQHGYLTAWRERARQPQEDRL
ncbi:hypothetical protein ACEZCY_13345 [Streptacidiphilus sp. N1-12]|uniref:HTH luxR-type domain-containing protein n=2 Tax=Streptacidiphilus alkalitolerans TaxID=3342712 RepID=A0ABV6V993_9ACTN